MSMKSLCSHGSEFLSLRVRNFVATRLVYYSFLSDFYEVLESSVMGGYVSPNLFTDSGRNLLARNQSHRGRSVIALGQPMN